MKVPSMGIAGPDPAVAMPAGPASSIPMTAVVKEALLDHYGKLEVAARAMRNMDPSQLSRELKTGDFKFDRLDALDADGKSAVTGALHGAFTQPDDPKAQLRREIRELRAKADSVAALAERLAS